MTAPLAGARHPLVERVLYYAARVRAWAQRATALGLAVRGLVWLLGCGALLLAVPPDHLLGAGLPAAALAALLPAVRPDGRSPALLAVAVLGLVAWRLVGQPPASPLAVVVPAAILLYLCHSAAALAAQLRTDTVIPAAVVRHQATRAVVTLGISAPVGLLVVALPAPATWPATALLGLGTAAAVAVTGLLLRLTRPRAEGP